MDGLNEPRDVPGWFWAVAIAALLFELLGCFTYWLQVSTDPSSLPIDQRAMVEAAPVWMTAAYAVAVWVGLAGAILLLLRRRHATTLLLVSLIAVIVQFSSLLIDPQLRDLATPDMYAGPIVIALFAYGVWHFSLYSKKRGWLR